MEIQLKPRKLMRLSEYSAAITIPLDWIYSTNAELGKPINISIDDKKRLILEVPK